MQVCNRRIKEFRDFSKIACVCRIIQSEDMSNNFYEGKQLQIIGIQSGYKFEATSNRTHVRTNLIHCFYASCPHLNML